MNQNDTTRILSVCVWSPVDERAGRVCPMNVMITETSNRTTISPYRQSGHPPGAAPAVVFVIWVSGVAGWVGEQTNGGRKQ